MPTVKTEDFEQLLDALRYRLNYFAANCIHEACRRLTFGSRKYGRQNFWKPLSSLDYPIEDDLQQYVIPFGKTSFGNMRGKESSPVKKIFKHLCYLSRVKHNISVITMDEYLTSQICANCDQHTLKNINERRNFDGTSGPKIHTLLNCETCSKYIFEHMATHDNERPQQFRRPLGSEPPPNVEE
ncbi:hypothetical protein BGW37DRAFT_478099 [Umbelopsis sp. PMI_123]|nr:hypothetical protein BGW37DRAFT_478099 [Umbelopsis sp. PMI_123]